MAVRISPGAKKYLATRGIKTVVLSYLEIEVADSIGLAKEVNISYDPPENTEGFLVYKIGDIRVFIDGKLKVTDDIFIKKQGFWKLSGLYADGFRIPI